MLLKTRVEYVLGCYKIRASTFDSLMEVKEKSCPIMYVVKGRFCGHLKQNCQLYCSFQTVE